MKTKKKAVAVVSEVAAAGRDLFLSELDLNRLMLATERVEKALMVVGMKQQEGQIDEAGMRLEQEKLQHLQSEFSLRSMKRMGEIQQLVRFQGAAIARYETLKKELSQKYGVDFAKAGFDDETGRIIVIPSEPEGSPT